VASPEALLVGARLDEDHSPETNGRMAVCRRCGAQTESPGGHQHVPDQTRLARAEHWLESQTLTRRIARGPGRTPIRPMV
jgi:hypothetical protein